jgi:methanogenic corrinoid protein MtbC1
LLTWWYLQGRNVSALFDGPVRGAMHRMGELWMHDERGILIEHQATDICIEAVTAIRMLLTPPEASAPVAIGGAPQGDPYQLPTMMAGVILAEAGFREVNFGPGTPIELLGSEAIRRAARLVWLSVSTPPPDPKAMRSAIAGLGEVLGKHGIELVIGGRHHAECAPRGLANVSLVNSMSELSAFARGVQSGHPTHARPEG